MDAKTDAAIAALDRLIAELHARGRPRVWSLAITLFGDAISPRGGTAALSTLQEILGRLGIEPGALRTAMHRLAAEGWVKRLKQGRNSFYRLNAGGSHAFDRATARIYAAGPPAWDGQWTLAIARPGADAPEAELLANDFTRIAAGVFVRPETSAAAWDETPAADMLILRAKADALPEWVAELWPVAPVAEAYRGLARSLGPLGAALDRGERLAGLDAVAARTLLIHNWRRIVLRDPMLPEALLPADWPGTEARASVAKIYRALAPASDAWLDEAGVGDVVERKAFEGRFG